MFKLVVLSVFIAVASAKPSGLIAPVLTKTVAYGAEPVITGYSASIIKPQLEVHAPLLKTAVIAEPSHVEVHEPTIAKVGEVIESIPTAVSHQSSTIVHSKANIVTPIVAPAVKSYAAPVFNTYAAAPVVSSYAAAPVVSSYAAAPVVSSYAAAPVVSSYAAGSVLNSYAASTPLLKSYTSGPLLSAAAPLTYAHAAPLLKSYAGPLAYSAAGPLAYSATGPLAYSATGPLAYSAAGHLAYAHTAPVLKSYAGPLAYSAPVVHAW